MEGVYALAFAVYALTTLLAVMVVYRPAGAAPRALTLLSEIREGLRYVRQSRALMGHLGITVIFNLFGFPYAAMVPVVGQQTFNANPVAIGLLQSIEGAGAFVGAMSIAFLASPTRFRLIYLWGTVLFLVCILLFSLTTSYPVAMVTLMASGFGLSGFAAMQSAIMFSEAPPEIRSRLMGILSVCIGVGPIGVLHVGWLAEHLGGSLALTVMSAEGLIALAVLVFLVPEVRR
jgi:predicted MFS family arabinose efflux permease